MRFTSRIIVIMGIALSFYNGFAETNTANGESISDIKEFKRAFFGEVICCSDYMVLDREENVSEELYSPMNFDLISETGTGEAADTVINDLSFDEFESEDSTDKNLGIFPEKMGLFEKAFWSENGLFRRVGIAGEATPDQRVREMKWRRNMLTAHQTSGLVTLGLMIASCYTGQMYLDGVHKDSKLHEGFVTGSIIGYSATGLLAMFAPPPAIRRNEISTITVHKTLAWLHAAGMILTPIIGSSLENSGVDFERRARFHQTSAYVTTGIYAAAMAVILLFE